MVRHMKLIILLLLAAVAAGAAYIGSDEYNRAGFFGSEGYIEAGSKFGIRIGMDHGAAVEKLRIDGLELLEPAEPRNCLGRAISTIQRVELWWDKSIFGGVICLVSRDNLIVGIGWSFGGWEF